VPVVGSARDAYRAFQNGDWGWGIFYAPLAITDVFLVKAIVVAAAKLVSKLVIKAAAVGAAKSAAKGGIGNSRTIGKAGEQAVGIGSKTRIPSLTGTAKFRIPDQLTSTTLGEVKNVRHLSLTRQLKDFHMYAQQTGRQFILYTRPNTTFSGPLQNLINNGSIITKPIPFK
jgi:hypothetical protein